MPRPFNNPNNEAQVAVNQVWREAQMQVPREGREAGWEWNAAWRMDDEDMLEDFQAPDLVDPFAVIPRAMRRDRERERGGLDIPANAQVLKQFPELSLDKLEPGPEILRDIKLPPFKIDYDSHEQIHQKLNNTIILIKNKPFHVRQTAEVKKGKFALVVSNTQMDARIVMYDDIKDCRGIAPGYYMYRGRAHWIYRVPERQNSQGMHQRNMNSKLAGNRDGQPATTNFLLDALANTIDVPYNDNLQQVLLAQDPSASLRLSNDIALYLTKKKGAPVGVEYRGRQLGLVVNGMCKVMDENDLRPSWIHKDVQRVGLVLSA